LKAQQLTLRDLPPLADRRRDEMLPAAEVAAYLNVQVGTLDKWRRPSAGRPVSGPPFVAINDGPKSPVRYPAGELQDWLAERRRQTAIKRAAAPGGRAA
jgi:hypothetical protein